MVAKLGTHRGSVEFEEDECSMCAGVAYMRMLDEEEVGVKERGIHRARGCAVKEERGGEGLKGMVVRDQLPGARGEFE